MSVLSSSSGCWRERAPRASARPWQALGHAPGPSKASAPAGDGCAVRADAAWRTLRRFDLRRCPFSPHELDGIIGVLVGCGGVLVVSRDGIEIETTALPCVPGCITASRRGHTRKQNTVTVLPRASSVLQSHPARTMPPSYYDAALPPAGGGGGADDRGAAERERARTVHVKVRGAPENGRQRAPPCRVERALCAALQPCCGRDRQLRRSCAMGGVLWRRSSLWRRPRRWVAQRQAPSSPPSAWAAWHAFQGLCPGPMVSVFDHSATSSEFTASKP